MGIEDTEGVAGQGENDNEVPIMKKQTMRAARSARALPVPPAGNANVSDLVDDGLPLVAIKGDSDDVEVFVPKKAVRTQRSAGPRAPILVQDESDLQSVFNSPKKAIPEHTHEKLVFDIK